MANGDIFTVIVVATTNLLVGDCVQIFVEGDVTASFADALTPDGTPNMTFTVAKVNGGYDSDGNLTDTSRVVYGTKVVRRPYPNQANLDLDTTTAPGFTIIRVALSETIYQGETVTCEIADGWATYSGGDVKGKVAGTSVTNNSTRTPPKVVAQWDFNAGVCAAERVTGTFTVACNARHKHGIAAVTFTAEGETSGNVVTKTATTQTATQRTVTGLYGSAFQTTIGMDEGTLFGFSQGEQIRLRFQAYPKVGGASQVLDSDTKNSAADINAGWINGWTRIHVTCDKDDSLRVWALVDGIGGSPAVNANKATARTTPFATIKAAFDAGATNVLLAAGTHAWGSNLAIARTTPWWQSVEPDTDGGATNQTALVQIPGVANWGNNIDRLRFSCGIAAVPGSVVNDQRGFYGVNTGRWGLFDGAYFDANGRTAGAAAPVWYEAGGCVVRNCTIEEPDRIRFGSASSSYEAFYFDGCILQSPGASEFTIDAVSRMSCCVINSGMAIAAPPLSDPWDPQNLMIECNEGLSLGDEQTMGFYESADAPTHGMSIMGNLFERIGTLSSPILGLGGQSDLASIENILICHNTFVGQRLNVGYNSGVTQSQVSRGWTQHGNLLRNWNSKHDVFHSNGALTHGWAMIYGVGFAHNHYEADQGFDGDYNGLDCTGATAVAADNNPQVVDNQEGTTSIGGDSVPYSGGAGGGDYTPDTGSPLLARVPVDRQHLVADLYGTAFATVADVGAIQVTADAAPEEPSASVLPDRTRARDSRQR